MTNPLPTKLRTFVIHLTRAAQRRAQVDAIVAASPFPAVVLSAVDGTAMSGPELAKAFRPNLFRPRHPFAVRPSEIACFLSHRAAWQAIVDENLDFGLIVEDDVDITSGQFEPALKLALGHASLNSYVRFPLFPSRESGEVLARDGALTLLRPALSGLRMQAQLVGRQAARNLLDATRVFDRPVDTFLQMHWLHGADILSVHPKVISEVSTAIGGSVIQHKSMPIAERLHREINRPLYRVALHRMHARANRAKDLPDNAVIVEGNKYGLTRDAEIIAGQLRALGQTATIVQMGSRSWLDRLLRRPVARRAIHLERILPGLRGAAEETVMIPNQEWFKPRHVSRLPSIDRVLAKTREAERIFYGLGCNTFLLGFSSPDRNDPSIRPDFGRFFHLAGGSFLKGTARLVRVWARHPEWPELTIVKSAGTPLVDVPDNVRLITDYLSDDELKNLQNSCGVHLCPSEVEGWGHYIVEGLSCGAVVVTTDAAPMNELIDRDFGVLVGYDKTEPRKLGTRYMVEEDALERAVTGLLAMDDGIKAEMGQKARLRYDALDAAFRQNVSELLYSPHPAKRKDRS
jgi:GR25 family glycosyltransferase involved in LPS biosynthesis